MYPYLAQVSATERTAYLREIGRAHRFQALDPLDRVAVLRAVPSVGMSAEALLFLWMDALADVLDLAGDAPCYAHWYDLRSSLGLAQ